jgi:hypothetical protein
MNKERRKELNAIYKALEEKKNSHVAALSEAKVRLDEAVENAVADLEEIKTAEFRAWSVYGRCRLRTRDGSGEDRVRPRDA